MKQIDALLVATSISLLVAAMPAGAQDPGPINAERPGFSSSPVTLAEGLWQIETGYQFTELNGAGAESHTLPLALLRYGLADGTELQFSWPGYTRIDTRGADVSGVTDASIGVKWQMSDADAVVPLALFFGASLPIGADRLSSDEVLPSLGVFWSYDPGIPLFGTAIVTSDDGDFSLGNGVGVSFPVSSQLGGYVEYFGLMAEGVGPEHYINGGITHLRRNNLQLDLHIGAGLNSRAADLFLGFGLAYRFDR